MRILQIITPEKWRWDRNIVVAKTKILLCTDFFLISVFRSMVYDGFTSGRHPNSGAGENKRRAVL